MNETSDSLNVLEPSPAPPQEPAAAHRPEAARAGRAAFLAWLGRALPTLLVLTALGGLAYWGHHTGWTMPKFSSLNGVVPEEEDWCKEHSVSESQCVECKPEVLPKGKDHGWCRQHGIHQCPLCHPEVAQLKSTPQVTAADRERAQRALATRERPENNSKCPLYRRRIQFASKEAMARAGVDVAVAEERPVTESISAYGEITYDPTRVARLSSRGPGTVWRAEKQVGDPVKAGEVLALVEAARVGEAKAEFLQALVQVELRGKVLTNMRTATGALPERQIQEAEAALREAQARFLSTRQALVNLGLPVSVQDLKGLNAEEVAVRLQFLGLPEALTRNLDPETTTANLLPVRAPLDGVVVQRDAAVGEAVDTARTLFVVADISQMWLTLSVRQEDVKYVKLGQPVRFRADGNGVEASGKVVWVSTAADQLSRLVKVRADLPNPAGRLHASTFGTGRIVLREEPKAVVVPSEAVQWDGSCHVVFVRDRNFLDKNAPKVFHTRTVRPGVRDDNYTEIVAGVLPYEVVVDRGSGVLRSELLKNNLGAG